MFFAGYCYAFFDKLKADRSLCNQANKVKLLIMSS